MTVSESSGSIQIGNFRECDDDLGGVAARQIFRRLMLTTSGVEAMICSHQPLDRFSANDVGFDDFVNIVGCYASIPDRVWIDHNVGTMFALIETTGLIRPHFPFKP